MTTDKLVEAAKNFGKPKDPKAWACALKAKHEAGEPLTEAQRTMWKAALGRGAEESEEL